MIRNIIKKNIFQIPNKNNLMLFSTTNYEKFFKFNKMIYYDNDRGIDKSTFYYDNNKIDKYEIIGQAKATFLQLSQLKTIKDFDKLKAYLNHYKNLDNDIILNDISNIDLTKLKNSGLLANPKNNFIILGMKDEKIKKIFKNYQGYEQYHINLLNIEDLINKCY